MTTITLLWRTGARLLLLVAFTAAATTSTTLAAPVQQTGALTFNALANAEYLLGDTEDDLVLLENGLYTDDERTVRLLAEHTAYGDFTGDGIEDAAVVLEIATPGEEIRYDLAIFIEQDGIPLNLVTLPLGDRIAINSIEMIAGEIIVNLVDLGPDAEPDDATDDAPQASALPLTQIFALDDDQILQFEVPGLSLDVLASATYSVETVPDEAITLVDGEFEDANAGLVVTLSGDHALGDLNADGVPDAAVIITSRTGGTGVFYDLAALLNLDGTPTHVAATFIGDRVRIEELFIENGVIVIDLITQGPDDPLCCPTQPARLGFALEENELVEVEVEVAQPEEIISLPYGPLLPFLGDGGYGFVNLAGDFVIEPQFRTVFPFVEGLAAASSDGSTFGYIDATGEYVIEPQFTLAQDFQQGIAVVALPDEGQGYINRQGQLLFDGATFAVASPFQEGLAAVRVADGQYGFIDRLGNMVIEPRFDSAQDFSGGLALVSIDGQYGFINRSGRYAIAAQFTRGGSFSEGLAPVEFFGQFGYISMLGDLVIGPQFESATRFREGIALVVLDGQEFYIDQEGNVLNANAAIGRGRAFAEGLAAVTIDGLTGYMNTSGELVIEPQFSGATDFENGLAVVQTDALWGVIDPAGNWLLQLPLQ